MIAIICTKGIHFRHSFAFGDSGGTTIFEGETWRLKKSGCCWHSCLSARQKLRVLGRLCKAICIPSFVIPAANGDTPASNWINKNEANNLQLQISLTGTGANVGDVLLITGWSSGQTWTYTRPDVAAANPITRFDANGDGANNDGLQITLSEVVRVKDLLNNANDFTSFTLTSSAGTPKTLNFGAGGRIEAINSSTLNGAQYSQTFKIYLGTGHNLVATDKLQITSSKFSNLAGNKPSADLVFSVPSLTVQSSLLPPLNITGNYHISGNAPYTYPFDNTINLVDLSKTKIPVTFYISGSTFNYSAGDNLSVYVNGKKSTTFSLSASSSATSYTVNSTNAALIASWARL